MDLVGLRNPEWDMEATCVLHPIGDGLGQIFAYSTIIPMVIFVLMSIFVIGIRDTHSITFLVGMLINLQLNVIVKSYWQQPRPPMPYKSGNYIAQF